MTLMLFLATASLSTGPNQAAKSIAGGGLQLLI